MVREPIGTLFKGAEREGRVAKLEGDALGREIELPLDELMEPQIRDGRLGPIPRDQKLVALLCRKGRGPCHRPYLS